MNPRRPLRSRALALPRRATTATLAAVFAAALLGQATSAAAAVSVPTVDSAHWVSRVAAGSSKPVSTSKVTWASDHAFIAGKVTTTSPAPKGASAPLLSHYRLATTGYVVKLPKAGIYRVSVVLAPVASAAGGKVYVGNVVGLTNLHGIKGRARVGSFSVVSQSTTMTVHFKGKLPVSGVQIYRMDGLVPTAASGFTSTTSTPESAPVTQAGNVTDPAGGTAAPTVPVTGAPVAAPVTTVTAPVTTAPVVAAPITSVPPNATVTDLPSSGIPTVPTTVTVPPVTVPVTSEGVFAGPCGQAAANAFATWRGNPVTTVTDSLDGRPWSTLAHPTFVSSCWTNPLQRLVLAVPILVSGETLAAGAAGAHDADFKSMAQTLIANHHADAILRLGWEFNGSWQPWAAGKDPASFIAYWRRIVTVMRAVPGAHFSFNWDLANGYAATDAATVYPGDDVVDSIGVNVYDNSWLPGTFPYADGETAAQRTARQQAAFAGIKGGPFGLDHWAAFAAAHGKAISLPEWGLVANGGPSAGNDDPTFVSGIHSWIAANHAAFAEYFDWTGALGDHRLRSGLVPTAQATYLQLFGGLTGS